jgi:hypothetical protein
MATVVFSPEIGQHISCPPLTVFGQTVKEILDGYFQRNKHVRDYIFDERGLLRARLAVFVDGVLAQDRIGLTDPVHLQANIFVFAQLDCQGGD